MSHKLYSAFPYATIYFRKLGYISLVITNFYMKQENLNRKQYVTQCLDLELTVRWIQEKTAKDISFYTLTVDISYYTVHAEMIEFDIQVQRIISTCSAGHIVPHVCLWTFASRFLKARGNINVVGHFVRFVSFFIDAANVNRNILYFFFKFGYKMYLQLVIKIANIFSV